MTDQEKPRSADYKLGYSSGYVAGQKAVMGKGPSQRIAKLNADNTKLRTDYDGLVERLKGYHDISETLDTVLDAVWRTLPMYVRDTLLLQFPDPVYACVKRLRTKDIEESEGHDDRI